MIMYKMLLAPAIALSFSLHLASCDEASSRTDSPRVLAANHAAEDQPKDAANDKAEADCEACEKCEGAVEKTPTPDSAHALIPIDGRPTLGSESADVTIVSFSDFQCPFCARGEKTLAALRQEYGDRIRVVYRQNPLSFHERAREAALASLAAGKQNAYAKFSDYLFENQRSLANADFSKVAGEMGLDVQQFDRDRKSDDLAKMVDEDLALAKEHGLRGTPSFAVNGVFIKGAQPIDAFKTVIDSELQAVADFKKNYRGSERDKYVQYLRSRK
jgi:protein-disulfide isomerase